MKGLSVKQLLDEVPVNRRTLERRFVSVLGHTPLEEIRRIRLERAKVLLQTDLPIYEVASRCGFATPEYMATSFLQAMDDADGVIAGNSPRGRAGSSSRRGEVGIAGGSNDLDNSSLQIEITAPGRATLCGSAVPAYFSPRPMYSWGEGQGEGRFFELRKPPLTLTLSPEYRGEGKEASDDDRRWITEYFSRPSLGGFLIPPLLGVEPH